MGTYTHILKRKKLNQFSYTLCVCIELAFASSCWQREAFQLYLGDRYSIEMGS